MNLVPGSHGLLPAHSIPFKLHKLPSTLGRKKSLQVGEKAQPSPVCVVTKPSGEDRFQCRHQGQAGDLGHRTRSPRRLSSTARGPPSPAWPLSQASQRRQTRLEPRRQTAG